MISDDQINEAGALLGYRPDSEIQWSPAMREHALHTAIRIETLKALSAIEAALRGGRS